MAVAIGLAAFVVDEAEGLVDGGVAVAIQLAGDPAVVHVVFVEDSFLQHVAAVVVLDRGQTVAVIPLVGQIIAAGVGAFRAVVFVVVLVGVRAIVGDQVAVAGDPGRKGSVLCIPLVILISLPPTGFEQAQSENPHSVYACRVASAFDSPIDNF